MVGYAIGVIGSITRTTFVKKALEDRSCRASVVQTPSIIRTGGCSYSIRFALEDVNVVKILLKDFDLVHKGIYKEEYNAKKGKVYIKI